MHSNWQSTGKIVLLKMNHRVLLKRSSSCLNRVRMGTLACSELRNEKPWRSESERQVTLRPSVPNILLITATSTSKRSKMLISAIKGLLSEQKSLKSDGSGSNQTSCVPRECHLVLIQSSESRNWQVSITKILLPIRDLITLLMHQWRVEQLTELKVKTKKETSHLQNILSKKNTNHLLKRRN